MSFVKLSIFGTSFEVLYYFITSNLYRFLLRLLPDMLISNLSEWVCFFPLLSTSPSLNDRHPKGAFGLVW